MRLYEGGIQPFWFTVKSNNTWPLILLQYYTMPYVMNFNFAIFANNLLVYPYIFTRRHNFNRIACFRHAGNGNMAINFAIYSDKNFYPNRRLRNSVVVGNFNMYIGNLDPPFRPTPGEVYWFAYHQNNLNISCYMRALSYRGLNGFGWFDLNNNNTLLGYIVIGINYNNNLPLQFPARNNNVVPLNTYPPAIGLL